MMASPAGTVQFLVVWRTFRPFCRPYGTRRFGSLRILGLKPRGYFLTCLRHFKAQGTLSSRRRRFTRRIPVRVGPCGSMREGFARHTPHFHRLRASRAAHAARPRKFTSSPECGTGALTGHFYFHRLRVSQWLMVRCPEVFASLLGSLSASSALLSFGFPGC